IYMRSAQAHNIPVIPGIRPMRKPIGEDERWGVREITNDERMISFEGETGMYPGARITRRIDVEQGNSITLHDRVLLQDKTLKSPSWFFHIPMDKALERLPNGILIIGHHADLKFE